ncbi:MAG: FkbM family methyltransferase [Beijerinckiaceae bacterium]|jgi:FkbM family methyltransferase|nr:FkbM family methyltransferase [Beijerinckiaceae bacterium]
MAGSHRKAAGAEIWPQGTTAAIRRSLNIYRRDRKRERWLDAWYGQFLSPGALAFDIGSHAGDRAACFARLGARVVAVEPQPAFARMLRMLHRRDDNVHVEQVALGATAGSLTLNINSENPTVSTLSSDFISAARGAVGWNTQTWSRSIETPVATFDMLIRKYGRPDFVKLDVEGWEHEALKGLTQTLPVLSFEFTTIQKDVALRCIERMAELGAVRFLASLGESLAYDCPTHRDAAAMAKWIEALPEAANSGDIYAFAEH